jgi:hypothetical protein
MASRPDFTRIHNRNILSEQATVLSKISPGHIVRFNYTGEHARIDRPLVLVLNPAYKGYLHGISLDAISDDTLEVLYDIIKETIADKIAKLTKLRLPLIKADIRDPKLFYERKIRSFVLGKNNPYRTYIRANITSTRIIDYRFKDKPKKSVLKKLKSIGRAPKR